jgi:ABC-type lipoprotein release transport system permease subunit
MLSEIKVALRGLAKTPGFTIIAIAMLALAIGANSAVFSLINALPVLAFMSPRTLSALLYNVGAFDAVTFIFVTVTLAAIALLASYIPALPATRADPMIALSHNA